MYYLLKEAQTDNGNTPEFTPNEVGAVEVFITGTWDSGVAKLQQETPAGVWYDLTSTINADGRLTATIYHKGNLRVNVASVAGAAADLDIYLAGVPAGGVTVAAN